MVIRLGLLVLTGLLWAPLGWGVIETYEFDSEELRQRYHRFVEELRCPKCQNQNLSGSNSAIAEDLRAQLHRLLQEGRSDEEIVEYMVSRYGDFILYRPPVNRHTMVLWALPAGLLLLGGLVAAGLLRRRPEPEVQALADDGREARVKELMARYPGDRS